MTAKYVSIRQKIGEKCIFLNAPIIPVPTGQKKMCFCLLSGTLCSGSLCVPGSLPMHCAVPPPRAQNADEKKAPHLSEEESLGKDWQAPL